MFSNVLDVLCCLLYEPCLRYLLADCRASCMDHSCAPNAVAVFSGTELHVRNTVAIETSQRTKVGVDQLHGWCQVKV